MACSVPWLPTGTPSCNRFSHCDRASLCDQHNMAEGMAWGFWDSLSKPGASHPLSSPTIPSSHRLLPSFSPTPSPSPLLLAPSLPFSFHLPPPLSHQCLGKSAATSWEERCGEKLKSSVSRHIRELGSRLPQSNLQRLSLAGTWKTISSELLSQSPQQSGSQVPEPQKLCEIVPVVLRWKLLQIEVMCYAAIEN